MRHLLLLTTISLAATISCTSSRNTSTQQNRQIPPGVYYDAHRTTEASQTPYKSRNDLDKRARDLLWGPDGKPKPEWHRPVTLPQIDIVDSKGNHWTNNDLKGRITIFNFWFSYCTPCMTEIPWLISLQDSFPECNFIGVTINEPSTVKEVMKRRKFKWAHVAADSTLTSWLPRETHYPTTIVVDQNGFVRTFNVGSSSVQQKRVTDTIKSIISRGPLDAPRHYKDLHYEEEYTNF